MSLGSTKGANIALDACYGDNHSSEWPSTVFLHLFAADPSIGGIELVPGFGGYTPLAIANNSVNWPPADGGIKSNGPTLLMAASTGPFNAAAEFFWLTDSATDLFPPTAPQVTPTGGTALTPWYYQITALNSMGETTPSGVGLTLIGVATLTGGSYNALVWNAIPGASSYQVYRSPSNAPGSFQLVANPSTNSYNDTGSATWAASTSYGTGAIVYPSAPTGFTYRCVFAGTSGSSPPTWGTVAGSTFGDNTVIWQTLNGPPVSNTTMTLLDGGPLSSPIIIPDAGYVVAFEPSTIAIAT